MAFQPTFMTKFSSQVGPRTSVCLREYTDGRSKICFYQTVFKKKQCVNVERLLSLNVGTWRKFVSSVMIIDQIIDDLRNGGTASLDLELHEDVRVRINPSFPFINVRKFWSPPNKTEKILTTNGICLKFDDYFVLKSLIPTLESLLPDLSDENTLKTEEGLLQITILERIYDACASVRVRAIMYACVFVCVK